MKHNPVHRSILWGIFYIGILGSLMHYFYEWSGKSLLVGLFSPVNESVWEHLKLAFYPTLLWWLISYFILSRKMELSFERWVFSAAIAMLISPLFIILFYYTYTGAFGFQSLFLDISSLYIGIIIAQCVALLIYKYTKIQKYHFYTGSIIILILLIAFIVFTINPPHIPLFKDSNTGTYGVS